MNRIACPIVLVGLVGAAGLFASSGLAGPATAARGPDVRKVAALNDIAVTLSADLPGDWFDQLQAMPNLNKLTIRNPGLQNLKVTQLRELKNLTEFSAEDFSIDTRLADIVAANIAKLPRLKSVQFHRTGLTGRGLQTLSRSPATELILDGEELLTDADFKHVAVMPSLNSLVLDSTPIDVDGLTTLQAASGLRRLVVRRHPAGSYEKGSEARVKAIAGFENLAELELGDAGYSHLVALKASKSLRLLTLRNCGGNDASKSLKQLTQLKRVEIDNCDIRNESFEDVQSGMAEIGIAFADVTRPSADLLTLTTAPADEATLLARRALEELDVGQRFQSFWVGWHHHWSKIPTMNAGPIRTVHRLKQALTAEHEKQPWQQDVTYAYAPGQFFMRNLSMENDVPGWEQTTYGDAKLAWSREGQTGKRFLHILRNGVREFEKSMGHQFPRQLFITHQHFWWGISTDHNTTSSAISPQKATYVELPVESFAGETCRVFQAPGRSERLWVSQATGRLRGALHYIHQGYFTPFYKQDVVTKAVGRRLESQEDYRKLWSGPGALAKEVHDQLIQAWAEHGFSHAYPGDLVVLDDYRKIAAGMWFPFKVTNAGWNHNQKNEGRFDFNVSESVVTELAIDRNDLEPYWADFLPNTGDSVQDQRFGVVLNYEFRRDRTQGEILEIVEAEKQKFASNAAMIKQTLAPLDELVGKQAPDLPAEGWIGGEMPKPDGKPYLVHFWATWCGPCKNDLPLLKKLAADGVRFVGMHPAGTPAGDVTKVIRDQELGYPTFLPSGNAAGDDRTIGGYPTAMFPYCILVDSEGRVAGHGSLSPELLAKLRALSAEKENRDAK